MSMGVGHTRLDTYMGSATGSSCAQTSAMHGQVPSTSMPAQSYTRTPYTQHCCCSPGRCWGRSSPHGVGSLGAASDRARAQDKDTVGRARQDLHTHQRLVSAIVLLARVAANLVWHAHNVCAPSVFICTPSLHMWSLSHCELDALQVTCI